MTTPSASSNRLHLIRLVHVAKRDLRMDDDAYRAILKARFNTESSADLSVLQLERLVSHFKACGFKVKQKAGTRTLASDSQSRKIRALWLVLHGAGVVRDSSENALAALVKRMAKVEALQWLKKDQASRVIEELKKWCDREKVNYED